MKEQIIKRFTLTSFKLKKKWLVISLIVSAFVLSFSIGSIAVFYFHFHPLITILSSSIPMLFLLPFLLALALPKKKAKKTKTIRNSSLLFNYINPSFELTNNSLLNIDIIRYLNFFPYAYKVEERNVTEGCILNKLISYSDLRITSKFTKLIANHKVHDRYFRSFDGNLVRIKADLCLPYSFRVFPKSHYSATSISEFLETTPLKMSSFHDPKLDKKYWLLGENEIFNDEYLIFLQRFFKRYHQNVAIYYEDAELLFFFSKNRVFSSKPIHSFHHLRRHYEKCSALMNFVSDLPEVEDKLGKEESNDTVA